MKFVYYGFTVKKLGQLTEQDNSIEMYDVWKHNCTLNGFDIEEEQWEFDSRHILHLHGIGIAKPRFIWKPLCLPGYTVHCFRIHSTFDMDKWKQYIKKDGLTLEAVREYVLGIEDIMLETASRQQYEALQWFTHNVYMTESDE